MDLFKKSHFETPNSIYEKKIVLGLRGEGLRAMSRQAKAEGCVQIPVKCLSGAVQWLTPRNSTELTSSIQLFIYHYHSPLTITAKTYYYRLEEGRRQRQITTEMTCPKNGRALRLTSLPLALLRNKYDIHQSLDFRYH
ncbi:Protein of unknown function [Gryllus bimaculatus]|nr:Protein of unknown function [Gryllus bimaculatus]